MKAHTYHLVSLGCAKNTVDSQSMAELLGRGGYAAVNKAGQAEVIIVNTCGFIQSARQESIEVLQDLAARKKKGQLLVAAGCLTEKYRQQIAREVTGLDGVLGTRRWMDILEVVNRVRTYRKNAGPLFHLPETQTIGTDEHGVLRAARQGGSAYLKIADGCRRPCAFCSIPLIKGTAVSRPVETILEEARQLERMGIQELILIAQDTTDYGSDLGIKDGLAILLERLAQTSPGIPWVRILYAYPGYVTERLIGIMAGSKQIVPYLDIPLQHAHPDTLLRMKRPANMDWVRRTLAEMRKAIPGLALRTTFIVGYPGETEAEFETLLDFVKETRFDHVGAFPFSFEAGTASEPLGDPVPNEVKLERLEQLMGLQEGISLEINQGLVGKTLQVLVEGSDDGISVGRSMRDAPEIDGLVIVEGIQETGRIVPVRINGAMVHDLSGTVEMAARSG